MKLPLSDERYQRFFENINASKERFIEKLNSKDNKILFIRSCEPMNYSDVGNRIIEDPKYKEEYAKDESEHLKDFSKLLTTKYPNLQFNILHMSGDMTYTDSEYKIITIPLPPFHWKNPRIGIKMKQHIQTYRDYIDSALKMMI
jgi:hypothetical protein